MPSIVSTLLAKSELKQGLFQSTLEMFGKLKTLAEAMAFQLSAHFEKEGKRIIVEFRDFNDYEFQLKFDGDVLSFTMHTNITGLLEDHIVLKNPYVQAEQERAYFGSILVYNFLEDSIKFNRLDDFGYLMARMLLNKDGHFYIEGMRQLNFRFPDIAQNIISDQVLSTFLESCMLLAIEQDLIAPNYQDIQVVTLEIKQANHVVNSGSKVGFQNTGQRG